MRLEDWNRLHAKRERGGPTALERRPTRPLDGERVSPRELLRSALLSSGLRRGVLALVHPRHGGALRLAAQVGFDGPEALPVFARCLQTAHRSGRVHVRLGDALRIGRFRTKLGAVIAVPIVVRGRPLGAVALEDPGCSLPLDDDARAELLEALRDTLPGFLTTLARRRRRSA